MLQKTVEYALRAVVCLAQEPSGHRSAERVARTTRIPRRYLHRVFQQLAQAGLVRSQPGPNGGYALSRPVEELALIDVINAIGPLDRICACPLGLKSHKQLCALHRELDKAYASIEAAFSNVTVAELLERPNGVRPFRDSRARTG